MRGAHGLALTNGANNGYPEGLRTSWRFGLGLDAYVEQMRAIVPTDLAELLDKRDGGAQLAAKLPLPMARSRWSERGEPASLGSLRLNPHEAQGRTEDALRIFEALYEKTLKYQDEHDVRVHRECRWCGLVTATASWATL